MTRLTANRKFHCREGRRRRRQIHVGHDERVLPVGRTPRVSQLMALAIRFDQLIRDGVVKDYADLARLGHISRARVT